jgi:hypothetical protein
MFNEPTSSSLEKSVFQQRFTHDHCIDVILAQFENRHDFGRNFFHKTLSKSILAPSSQKPSLESEAS